MSTNGKWIHSIWTNRGVKSFYPRKSGWYAAKPEDCNSCYVKLYVTENLYDCIVLGDELYRNVEEYEWWYPLKSQYDNIPEFRT